MNIPFYGKYCLVIALKSILAKSISFKLVNIQFIPNVKVIILMSVSWYYSYRYIDTFSFHYNISS